MNDAHSKRPGLRAIRTPPTASQADVVVGIDLGTTYSLIAVLQAGEPIVIPNTDGELLTASAVAVDGDTLIVGAPAAARAANHPETVARFFKRDMGTDHVRQLGGRNATPQELSAWVLGALKRDAESFLGRPVERAVITVPAYFGDRQRQATKDAGAIAGLRVERIINEPTAAALAYGLHERHRELRAVVLDLGGGTFDVTVLEIIEGVIEIQSSAGDARLGGEDYADALAANAIERIEAAHGPVTHGVARARIREAVDDAKRRLTERDEVLLALPSLRIGGENIDVEIPITRAAAEHVWQPLLSRIAFPIHRALRDAQLTPRDIDEVLLVGGATRMPCVVQLAASIFGRMPHRDLPPDEAVAQGAAVQAALVLGDDAVDDLVVTDVAPFTLGLATANRVGTKMVDGLFTPILERGTTIPASRVERFSTMEDRQRAISVEVFQGEHSLCRDNTKLGVYLLDDLPLRAAGEVSVDVRFTYDLDGILEVEMSVVGTDRTEHLVVTDRPGQLTDAQIAAARKKMEKLKFHPRDTLPNRTALARADALYVELSGRPRETLGAAINQLRLALETQEPTLIEAARQRLVAMTQRLR